MQKNWTDCRRKSVNCGQFQTTRQAEGALLLLVTRRQAAGSTCSLLVFVGWAKHRNSTDCATLKTITMKRNDSENGHVSSFSFWSSHKIVFICAGHINKYWQRVTWRYGGAQWEVQVESSQLSGSGPIFTFIFEADANELFKFFVIAR